LKDLDNKNYDNCQNIIDVYINYFKNDIKMLISQGYDINEINEFYIVDKKSYTKEKVSLLGFFIYKSIRYFFDINDLNKSNILYDVIVKIFIFLIENGCNSNLVNYFPDNNVMSISSYILIYMAFFNNKRLDLLRDKNLFKVTLDSMNLSEVSNINDNIQESKNNMCINDFTKRLEKINFNIDRIRTGLSLLTWMFDSLMIFPSTINSEIVNIGDIKSIKNVRELIDSELIVKECKEYLIKKHNL
jgi:hypothetical protein